MRLNYPSPPQNAYTSRKYRTKHLKYLILPPPIPLSPNIQAHFSTPYTSTPYTSTPYTSTPYTSTPYTSTPYTSTPYTSDTYTFSATFSSLLLAPILPMPPPECVYTTTSNYTASSDPLDVLYPNSDQPTHSHLNCTCAPGLFL
jgi:hypothetical protein